MSGLAHSFSFVTDFSYIFLFLIDIKIMSGCLRISFDNLEREQEEKVFYRGILKGLIRLAVTDSKLDGPAHAKVYIGTRKYSLKIQIFFIKCYFKE